MLHSSCSCMFLTVEWRCVVCSTLRVLVCFSRSSGGAWCAPLFMFLYVSHGRVKVRGVLHSSCSCMFLTVEWRLSGGAWCAPLFMFLYVSDGRVEVRGVLHSSHFSRECLRMAAHHRAFHHPCFVYVVLCIHNLGSHHSLCRHLWPRVLFVGDLFLGWIQPYFVWGCLVVSGPNIYYS